VIAVTFWVLRRNGKMQRTFHESTTAESHVSGTGPRSVVSILRVIRLIIACAAVAFLSRIVAVAGVPILDCNGNGIEDAEDLASGTSSDCDFNDVPDECVTDIVFQENFPTQQLDPRRWALWAAPSVWIQGTGPSPPYVLRLRERERIYSEPFTVANTQNAVLRYRWSRATSGQEPSTADLRVFLEGVGSEVAVELRRHDADSPGCCTYHEEVIPLPSEAYEATFRLAFYCLFSYSDSVWWYVDDIRITADEIADCNGSGIPDACELLADDNDGSGLPDVCESLDCNANEVPDELEVAEGSATDCDLNGWLDECEWPAVLETRTPPSDAAPYDYFGQAVSVLGDTAMIGAPHTRDTSGALPGVYVFTRRDGTWSQRARLVAADTQPEDRLGWAISQSGERVLIGAPWKNDLEEMSGAAYVFRQEGADPFTWAEESKLTLPDASDRVLYFGQSVALDGNLALVGAWLDEWPADDRGVAVLHRFDGEDWVAVHTFYASSPTPQDQFGQAVALKGDVIAIGAPGVSVPDEHPGVVYVYRYDGGTWAEEARLSQGDSGAHSTFGYAVAVSGEVLAVGDWRFRDREGAVYVYRYDGSTWELDATVRPKIPEWNLDFGVALDLSGDALLVGTNRDDVFLYRYDAAVPERWPLLHVLPDERGDALGERFGTALAIDGARAVVGASGAHHVGAFSGKAHFFRVIATCGGNDTLDTCAIASGLGTDCNSNGVPDHCDTATGRSRDCNDNSIPDDCEADCNCNGIDDVTETSSGASPDCNGNGAPDACDVSVFGRSYDCDQNGVPDECDADCNANGTPDACDLASVTSWDCNGNLVPDECDITGLTSADCEPNGAPDECLFEAFEFIEEVPTDTVDPMRWAINEGVVVTNRGLNEPSPPYALRFDIEPLEFDDAIESVSMDLSGRLNAVLSYHWQKGGSLDPPDPGQKLSCAYRDWNGEWRLVAEDEGGGTAMSEFAEERFILPPDAYHSNFAIRFQLKSSTACTCGRDNWLVDDVKVITEGVYDCDGDEAPDACEIAGGAPDCNANHIPDSCDIASGVSDDCNGNEIPDACDINSGAAADCNANRVPDSCDLASGFADDCNENTIPDSCDVVSGTDTDCDRNGALDSCDLATGDGDDCNENRILDQCEALWGLDRDCNWNDVLDSCDLEDGAAYDCNENTWLDECEYLGDYDGDDRSTLADFAAYQRCYAGQDVAPDDPCCLLFDLNHNGLLDPYDLFLFTYELSGP
jgi:hypothetical protein